MSWFGERLSNLGGQLTTLTRDILNEGTEEIEDPETALKLAKSKISELENQITSQQYEIQRLVSMNDELQVKADSSEIQINHLNEKYRQQLAEKQQELDYCLCQLEQRIRGEPEGASNCVSVMPKTSLPNNTTENNRVRSDSSDNYFDNDDSFDFASEDAIQPNSFQDLVQQNQTLHRQIKQLKAELKNCKNQMLVQTNSCTAQDDAQQSLQHYQQELESLRFELSRKDENHHSEMEALYEDHKRRINDLKRSHKEQLEDLEEQIQSDSIDRFQQTPPSLQSQKTFIDASTDCYCSDEFATEYQQELDRKNELIETLEEEIARFTRHQDESKLKDLSVSFTPCDSNDVATQLSPSELSPETHDNFSFNKANYHKSPMGLDICDSQSQMSDVSEISLLSRQLDDHVILLSNQMHQYEEDMKRVVGGDTSEESRVKDKLARKQETLSRLLKKQEALRSKRKAIIKTPIEESLAEMSDREHSPTPTKEIDSQFKHSIPKTNLSTEAEWEESEESDTEENTEDLQKSSEVSNHKDASPPAISSTLNKRIEELEQMLADKQEKINSFDELLLVINEATVFLNQQLTQNDLNISPSDRIKLLARELSNLSIKYESLQEQFNERSCVANRYEELAEVLRQNIDLSMCESDQLSTQVTQYLHTMMQQVANYRDVIGEKQRELEEIRYGLEDSQTTVAALDGENQQLQALISSMKERQKDSSEKEKELLDQLKEKEETLDELRQSREDDVKELVSVMNALKEQENVLEDNETLRNRIREVEEELSLVKLRIPSQSNNECHLDMEESNVDEDHLRDLKVKLESLEQEVLAERKKSADLMCSLEASENEKKVEYQKFKEERDGLEMTIIQLQAKIDSVNRSNDDSSISADNNEDSVSLRDEIKTLTEDCSNLKSHFEEIVQEKESTKQSLKDVQQENLNLQSEVDRLIKTLSSQGEVLNELSEQKQQLEQSLELLSQNQPNPKMEEEDEGESMSKEAIKNLSSLIREKEFEIDSLKQKNDSLLEMIREFGGPDVSLDSSNEETTLTTSGAEIQKSSAMQKLLQERENLSRQLKAFQQDREQLIAALNQKHHESLSYHNEIQRLVAYIQTERPKWEAADKELKEIQMNLNEKSNALSVCQNELHQLRQEHNQLSITLESIEQQNEEPSIHSKHKETDHSQLNEKLIEKEKLCQDLRSELNSVYNQTSELAALKKQLERLSFQLSESQLQISELTSNETALKSRVKQHEETAELLRSQLQQMTLQSSAISGSTEANSSADDHQVIKERDQLALALNQSREEICAFKVEFNTLQDRESKLLNEISRLRDHLVKIEEGYTMEALEAESRETTLRERIRNLEESSSSSMLSVEHTLHEQKQMLDSVSAQLQSVTRERDITLDRLSRCQNDLQQQIVSVTNLQTVLDNFQRDQEATIATETERYLREVSRLKTEIAVVTNENNDLTNQLKAQSNLIEAAHRLSEQLDKKEAAMLRMQELNNDKERLMDEMKSEIRRLNNTSENKIDKELMKNLLIGYFHTPNHMKKDALRVIGNLLHFTDEQFEKIGIDVSNKSGWLSWLKKPLSKPDRKRSSDSQSFTELFVNFLDRESRPSVPLKIPTDELVAEMTSRKRNSSQSSTTSHSSATHHHHPETPPTNSTPVRSSEESHSATLYVNMTPPATTTSSNYSSTNNASSSLSAMGKNPLLYILQDQS